MVPLRVATHQVTAPGPVTLTTSSMNPVHLYTVYYVSTLNYFTCGIGSSDHTTVCTSTNSNELAAFCSPFTHAGIELELNITVTVSLSMQDQLRNMQNVNQTD